jgi:mRNA interferase MazF
LPVTGAVGADQVKSLDWRARKASWIGTVPEQVVAEVVRRLQTLLVNDV